MPGPSGLELQAALRRQGVPLPVIFLTGHADVASSVRAMQAGAVDFLTKPVQRDTLLEALRRALDRDARQRAARTEADALRHRLASLTPREREVFDAVASGKLNKQIADELDDGGTHREAPSGPRHGEAIRRLPGRARPPGGEAAAPVGPVAPGLALSGKAVLPFVRLPRDRCRDEHAGHADVVIGGR